MARQAVIPQTPTRSGLTPTFTGAHVDGHAFANNGQTVARFRNTTASPVEVTVQFGGSKDGIAIDGGRTVTVPATTGDVITAVWPKDDYDQGDGTVWVDFSASDAGIDAAYLSV